MVVGISRATQCSPNSVTKDRAILEAVVSRLGGVIVDENSFCGNPVNADCYVSMARLPRTIALLKQKEDGGALVVNSAYGVERCRRDILEGIMLANDVPVPAKDGDDGYWIKSAEAAQCADDVMFCRDKAELEEVKRHFEARGITRYVVSAHVTGDLVKFYGVKGTDFFRLYYPTEEGISKFGNEERNGKPQHYNFSVYDLQTVAERVAKAANVPIYGGDAIITSEGNFYVIDFNDFPSFSLCREEAGEAMAELVKNRIYYDQ